MSNRPTGINRFWPIERIEQLRSMAAAGLSSNQIGERLGASKNSIVSKCHRMDIPLLIPLYGGGSDNRKRPLPPPRTVIPSAGLVTLPQLPSLSVPMWVMSGEPKV